VGENLLRRFLIFLALLGMASPSFAGPAESISEFRRSHGLSPVKVDPVLTRLAHEQAEAMAQSGNMDHNVKGSFGSRIARYPTNHAAENIAMGNATFEATLRQWENSSGHRANLLLKNVSRIGIASAGTGQRTYWSLILAAAPSARPATRHVAEEASAAPTKKHAPVHETGLLENLILKLPWSSKR
jgi:hypothetical protein